MWAQSVNGNSSEAIPQGDGTEVCLWLNTTCIECWSCASGQAGTELCLFVPHTNLGKREVPYKQWERCLAVLRAEMVRLAAGISLSVVLNPAFLFRYFSTAKQRKAFMEHLLSLKRLSEQLQKQPVSSALSWGALEASPEPGADRGLPVLRGRGAVPHRASTGGTALLLPGAGLIWWGKTSDNLISLPSKKFYSLSQGHSARNPT